MSSPGFSVDNERLAQHAADFGAHADTAGDIAGALRQAVEATGSCWGSDEVGRSFAAGHVEAASQTLNHLGSLPERLGDVATRFADTAATYQQAEVDNHHVMGSVDRTR